MSATEKQKPTGKTFLLLILGAIVTAVVVTLVQVLLRGSSNIAVTGGVVGALTAVAAIKTMKR
jgi:predicted membrane protein